MDAKQIIGWLQGMGVNTSGLTPDNLSSRLSERIVLKKFDGDDTSGEPVETIVIENGEMKCL